MTPFNERDSENIAFNLKLNFPTCEGLGPATKEQRVLANAAADRLMEQREEIERLRIQLEFTDKIKLRLPPDLNDLVNDTLERAAQACEVEAIDLEYSEHIEVDFPYNQAVKDCAMAIRAIKSGEPK